jgi:hypothetical protein
VNLDPHDPDMNRPLTPGERKALGVIAVIAAAIAAYVISPGMPSVFYAAGVLLIAVMAWILLSLVTASEIADEDKRNREFDKDGE